MTSTAQWFTQHYQRPGESLTEAYKRFAHAAGISRSSAYYVARGYRVGELVRTKALRYGKRLGLQAHWFDDAPEYGQ
jgi:hypothetical protein